MGPPNSEPLYLLHVRRLRATNACPGRADRLHAHTPRSAPESEVSLGRADAAGRLIRATGAAK